MLFWNHKKCNYFCDIMSCVAFGRTTWNTEFPSPWAHASRNKFRNTRIEVIWDLSLFTIGVFTVLSVLTRVRQF